MKRYPFISICLLIILICSSIGFAAGLPDYMAKYLVTTGKETMEQTIYTQSNATKFRMEMKSKQGDVVSIVRMDKKVTWLLMIPDKSYIEQAFDPNALSNYRADEDFLETKAKKIGTETILGYTCDIYEYKSGKSVSKVSIAQKLGILLKSVTVEGKQTTTMEAKEVKVGPQPNSLFEIPAGFQKLSFKLPSFN